MTKSASKAIPQFRLNPSDAAQRVYKALVGADGYTLIYQDIRCNVAPYVVNKAEAPQYEDQREAAYVGESLANTILANNPRAPQKLRDQIDYLARYASHPPRGDEPDFHQLDREHAASIAALVYLTIISSDPRHGNVADVLYIAEKRIGQPQNPHEKALRAAIAAWAANAAWRAEQAAQAETQPNP